MYLKNFFFKVLIKKFNIIDKNKVNLIHVNNFLATVLKILK